MKEQQRFLPDYARFDVLVGEVLAGEAPERLTVAWDNSTFGEPESMPEGEYVIALRDAASTVPRLRGPSSTVSSSPIAELPTVLQAPCAPAFIFPGTSREAAAIRNLLGREK